jgi:hypothetical protein
VCLMPINQEMVMGIGRQYEVKILMKVWNGLSSSMIGEDLVREWNHNSKVTTREDASRSFLIGLPVEAGTRNIGAAEFSRWTGLQQGKAGSDRYEGSERSSSMKDAF